MSTNKDIFETTRITPINAVPIALPRNSLGDVSTMEEGGECSDSRSFIAPLVGDCTMYTRISKKVLPASSSPIVLVHGLSVSSGYMLPTAERLASSYRVYIPDLPGFGKSAKPPHILNVPELADALAGWMQAMDLPAATFLGNSLGCQIIVNLALRYPERIQRAILVSPTMDPQALTVHQMAWRLLLDTFCEPPSFLPVLLREYMAAGIPRTLRTLQYGFADPMKKHLPHVHIPVLVVRGARDPIVPQEWAEEVDQLLPTSQLAIVQGAGHAVNFNSPEELVSLVQSFLSERERSL